MTRHRSRQQIPRPWEDAPHLLPPLIDPLVQAFVTGPEPVEVCPHLDGLEAISDLDQAAAWVPGIRAALLCARCFEQELFTAQREHPSRLACDGCSVPTLRRRLTQFTSAITEPDGPLLVTGWFCASCMRPPREAA